MTVRRHEYFEEMARQIIREIEIMYSLRGEENIVGYEDHMVLHEPNSLRWEIFIRMELLVPLGTYIRNNAITPEDVRRLGIEICNALEACDSYSIIHRDIKEDIVSWLGDSRVYMLRSGKLRQLTQDHTEAERLRKLGIAAADKRSHNSLTRYLGMNMEGMVLTPSYCEPIAIKRNDMFLICSDGLTSMVNDEEIAAIMRESQKPAYDLVNAALKAGGTDNVTAAVIGVESLKQWQMKRSIKSRTVLALTLCMPFMQAR